MARQPRSKTFDPNAEAGKTAGPWTHWRSQHQPLKTGNLSRRLIRSEEFIDKLIGIYDDAVDADTSS